MVFSEGKNLGCKADDFLPFIFVKKVFVVTIIKNVIERWVVRRSKRSILNRGKAANVIKARHEKVTISNTISGHRRGLVATA